MGYRLLRQLLTGRSVAHLKRNSYFKITVALQFTSNQLASYHVILHHLVDAYSNTDFQRLK